LTPGKGGGNIQIDNINITLQQGEIAAIVGRNGSGKTTLAKLLLGIYQPDTGRIMYDGMDISALDPAARYQNVSVVFQDFNHYYLTVRENIGISDTMNINDMDKIKAACIKAGDYDFIEKLQDGIETMLGREYGGTELSGGQWQHLALARGYFRESAFIILDEPSSALDPFKESRMYENFKNLCHNKTGIIITHRLSAASLADRIILIDNGQIIEQGSHNELYSKKGHYWEMYKAQANLYAGTGGT
jgi:ATP-binding cassette subfamily B protein